MNKLMVLITMMIVTVGLLSAGTVEGVVTDIDTGEAISGATVRFVLTGECDGSGRDGNGNHHGQGNGGGNGNNAYTTVTDENGNYLIEDIADGVYTGIARKQAEYPSLHLEDIEIIGNVTVNFELTPGNCGPPSRKHLGSGFQRD